MCAFSAVVCLRKMRIVQAIIVFTKGFSCDYPGRYANALRAQGTAVFVISLDNTTVAVRPDAATANSSINSQMLMENDIHALLALLREQYCKLQQQQLAITSVGYGS